jgi:hypothetical protein
MYGSKMVTNTAILNSLFAQSSAALYAQKHAVYMDPVRICTKEASETRLFQVRFAEQDGNCPDSTPGVVASQNFKRDLDHRALYEHVKQFAASEKAAGEALVDAFLAASNCRLADPRSDAMFFFTMSTHFTAQINQTGCKTAQQESDEFLTEEYNTSKKVSRGPAKYGAGVRLYADTSNERANSTVSIHARCQYIMGVVSLLRILSDAFHTAYAFCHASSRRV